MSFKGFSSLMFVTFFILGIFPFAEDLQLLEIQFETSFGYSMTDYTITSYYGTDLGTHEEHFGYVPTSGYAVILKKGKFGLRFGMMYQRSNCSKFDIHSEKSDFINYSLTESYLQMFYKITIVKHLSCILYSGLIMPFSSIEVRSSYFYYTAWSRYIILPYDSHINYIVSIKLKYQFTETSGLSAVYNFSGYKQHNLSLGLSFKLAKWSRE